ncbi:MAG: hypothetical protein WA099_05630 [Sulfuricurvum sp.]
MTTVTTTDILRHPALLNAIDGITLIEDGRRHEPKSVLLPYALYQKVRERIEDELYLMSNQKALSTEAYKEFLEIEEVIEDLG